MLGGTHQVGDNNQNVCEIDREFIWKGCSKISASLANAKFVREWVGLRPGRSSVRLESEMVATTDNGTKAA